MADIVLDLGSVTLKDNTPESGKLTLQHFKDWLDEQFDKEGTGGNYLARMTTAVRQIGIRGAQRRCHAFTNQKIRQAASGVSADIISEE